MAKQPRIAIAFYTPAKDRQIAVPNNVGKFFAQAERVAKGLPRWTLRDFDLAREQVYAKYPEVQDLWRAMAGV